MEKFTGIEHWIANVLNKIGVDKALHFLVAWAVVATALIYGMGPGGWTLFGVVAASFIKEKFIDEKFDFADVMATFFGGVVPLILYIPYDIFFN